MKRLKIYFMHSSKFDYNSLIYKNVLGSAVCLNHNLILPLSNEYNEKYAKELIQSSDLIFVFLNNYSLGLSLELKWAFKYQKECIFISFDKKIPPKILKKINQIIYINEDNLLINIVESNIKKYEQIKEKENDIQVLGEL